VADRREFLKSGIILGSTLSSFGTPNVKKAQTTPDAVIPTSKAKELMARFDLKCPIFQAPHNGAGPDLVAAVSSAGGLGILGGLIQSHA
jgi:hypothetical protein